MIRDRAGLIQVAAEVLQANMDIIRVEDYVIMYGLSPDEADELYHMLDALDVEHFYIALTRANALRHPEIQDLS